VKIVDAQVHIWANSTPQRPWPPRHPPHREQPFSAAELIAEMDAAGVDAAVLVPPSWEGEYNDLVTQAVLAYPSRFAAMGVVSPADAPALMARWPFPPAVRGLRFAVHRPGLVEALTDGRMDRVWAAAEEHGVPLMVLLPHELLHVLDAAARRHPTLKLIVDHLGMVFAPPGDVRATFRAVLPLADRPNVALKATSLPLVSSGPYPYEDLHPLIRDAVGAFGAERLFWGTDVTRLPCTYRQAALMVMERMPFLTAPQIEWIMGRGICAWLDWHKET
jgi:predicted TIM-barrel fold metal-dependent hydrolase